MTCQKLIGSHYFSKYHSSALEAREIGSLPTQNRFSKLQFLIALTPGFKRILIQFNSKFHHSFQSTSLCALKLGIDHNCVEAELLHCINSNINVLFLNKQSSLPVQIIQSQRLWYCLHSIAERIENMFEFYQTSIQD